MPNQITSTGIEIQTRPEIVAAFEAAWRAIYGDDINLDPNSPDGQLINIESEAKQDVLEFIVAVYNSFDPDQAIGVTLDERCAINGVIRAGGTYTLQPVVVTVDRALTLYGLDSNPLTPFTVSDQAGNEFQLVSDHVFSGAGSATLTFQASLIGEVLTVPNTITRIITITLGVVSVNNPGSASEVGVNQESDYALRIRRSQSVALPSQGYLQGLLGALLGVPGVTEAVVFENNTNSTDSNGIPGHSIWVIVAGGDADEIADVIYKKRNAGCGMKGDTVVAVLQVDGTLLDISFDRPIPEDLYITFDVEPITGSIDDDYLRDQLEARLSYDIAQSADTASIIALIKEIYPNASVSNEGVSNDGIYYDTLLATSTVQNQFAVVQIEINGVY